MSRILCFVLLVVANYFSLHSLYRTQRINASNIAFTINMPLHCRYQPCSYSTHKPARIFPTIAFLHCADFEVITTKSPPSLKLFDDHQEGNLCAPFFCTHSGPSSAYKATTFCSADGHHLIPLIYTGVKVCSYAYI